MVNIELTPEILENLFNEKIKLVSVLPGTVDGDGYTSQIFSLKFQLEGEEKEKEYFFKTLPSNHLRIEWLKVNNCFYKEFKFYSEYVPKINEIYAEKTNYKLKFPEYFKGNICDFSKEVNEAEFPLENNFICLEDMKPRGFGMDRFRDLTLDHCKLAIDSFARNHAGSWAYKQRHGLKSLKEEFSYFKETLFLPNSGFPELIYPCLEKVKEGIMRTSGNDGDVYKAVDKISQKKNLVEEIILHTIPDEDALQNLQRVPSPYPKSLLEHSWLLQCSGDVWKGNMLFKYDESDNPIEITQVDFQFIHECCPTFDLIFFLSTSVSVQLRKIHTDELLQFYADKFLGYCKALEVPPLPGFNLETIKARYHRLKYFGFLIAVLVVPFKCKKPEKKSFDEKLQDVTDVDMVWENAISFEDDDLQEKIFIEEALYAFEEGII